MKPIKILAPEKLLAPRETLRARRLKLSSAPRMELPHHSVGHLLEGDSVHAEVAALLSAQVEVEFSRLRDNLVEIPDRRVLLHVQMLQEC